MQNPLTVKLSSFADFSDADRKALDHLCDSHRFYKARSNLIREGDRPEHVFFLLEGWAFRYKILADGKRQIVAYLIPGDLCDINIFILKKMDHGIGLLSDANVAAIPKKVMLQTMHDYPKIAQALFWATLVDEATLREWVANVGQRDALESIAHLLCELWVRLSTVGLVVGNTFALPLTQEQLGDTVGLTSVHVNRMVQTLRKQGLIATNGKQIEILDAKALRALAHFNPNYLHLDQRPDIVSPGHSSQTPWR